MRCINDNRKAILEGELRCTELKAYLAERNAGKDVWLCEDASGLISKIQYDQTADQLIGIVLPLDDENGSPTRYEHTARDQEEITKFMQFKKSSLVYIVVAVPLKEGVPPFILQMYGTDNRFKATDVIKRWNHTIESLKRYVKSLFIVVDWQNVQLTVSVDTCSRFFSSCSFSPLFFNDTKRIKCVLMMIRSE